jgi:hypothetical protein
MKRNELLEALRCGVVTYNEPYGYFDGKIDEIETEELMGAAADEIETLEFEVGESHREID